MYAGRIQKALDDIRYSYWFLPAVLAIGSMALAGASLWIDASGLLHADNRPGWLYSGGPDGARSVLATIAGSMLGVAGVTFSVIIVALTVAAQQFGPRVLVNFMRDRGNQLVLGTYIATFLYCLLVLRRVQGESEQVQLFVPHLSVTIAVLLATASLGVLIYFIHHAALSIQVSSIIDGVGKELDHTIERLFPEPLGYAPRSEQDPEAALPDGHCVGVAATRTGYVQVIDEERLLRLARQRDLVLHLRRRPGGLVVEGDLLLEVWPPEHCDDALVRRLRHAVLLNFQRTPAQDVGFSIDQLAEIASRALSPGLNDPQTAHVVVDRLAASLGLLARRELPSRFRFDEDGVLRIVTPAVDWSEVFGQAFGPIRRYGAGHFSVALRILEMMQRLAVDVRRAADREALRREAEQVLAAARRSDLPPADTDQIEEQYRHTMWSLRPRAAAEDEEQAAG